MSGAILAAISSLGSVIIVLILVAIVGSIIGYYMTRFLKGSIKLNLQRTSYGAGELIGGSFDLTTKKAVEGNELRVSLIGEKVTRRRSGDSTKTHRDEVYRDFVVIEGPRDYAPGTRECHAFELKVPDMSAPDFLESGVGKALMTAAKFMGGNRSRIEWKLVVRLDAKGVDLAASKRLRLNTGA